MQKAVACEQPVTSICSSAAKLLVHQPLLPRCALLEGTCPPCDNQDFQQQTASSSHTSGKGTSAKQATETWPAGTSHQAARPKCRIEPASRRAGLVAKKWLKEPSSPFPRPQAHTPMHFLLCSLTDAASVPSPSRARGPAARLRSCASAQPCEAARWRCCKRTRGCSCCLLRR